MKYAKNILETIGNTPLVKLNVLTKELPCLVLSKYETFNPCCLNNMLLKCWGFVDMVLPIYILQLIKRQNIQEKYAALMDSYFNDLKNKCLQYKITYLPVDIQQGFNEILEKPKSLNLKKTNHFTVKSTNNWRLYMETIIVGYWLLLPLCFPRNFHIKSADVLGIDLLIRLQF